MTTRPRWRATEPRSRRRSAPRRRASPTRCTAPTCGGSPSKPLRRASGCAPTARRPTGRASRWRSLVADCLPVAVAGGGAAAILHAGWRGLDGGVLAAGVRAVRELGDQGELVAAIGPGAGSCCYEVGEEVHAAFADYAGVRRGDNLDLKEIARRQLLAAGVSAVHDIALCTMCSPPELLYSHRRDGGVTGRQAGVAWLT